MDYRHVCIKWYNSKKESQNIDSCNRRWVGATEEGKIENEPSHKNQK